MVLCKHMPSDQWEIITSSYRHPYFTIPRDPSAVLRSVTVVGIQESCRLYLPHTDPHRIVCAAVEDPHRSVLHPVTVHLTPFIRGLPILTKVWIDAPPNSQVYCTLDRLTDRDASELVTFWSVERPHRGLIVLLESGYRVQYCPAVATGDQEGWSLVDWEGVDTTNEMSTETGSRFVPWVGIASASPM